MKIKKLIFNGFGFPIELHDIPAKEIRGNIEPIINYRNLALKVISEICSAENKIPLTGRQVFFLRNHLQMTIRDFGKFLEVTHPAVKKWEDAGDAVTKMSDSTEKILRLKVLDFIGIKPSKFLEIFKKLDIEHNKKPSKEPLQISL